MTAAPTVDCARLVPDIVDASPVRSPQALHSLIASRVANKTLVEIGTRNGDGLACFAQLAASATAVEASQIYCDKLRQRAQSLASRVPPAHGFAVVCSRYQSARQLDADVFTWWQMAPHLTDAALLTHLRREQRAGRVRSSAVALIAFDLSWAPDRRSLRQLTPRASSVV